MMETLDWYQITAGVAIAVSVIVLLYVVGMRFALKEKVKRRYDVGQLYICISYLDDKQEVAYESVEIKGSVWAPETEFGDITQAKDRAKNRVSRWFEKKYISIESKNYVFVIPTCRVLSIVIQDQESYTVDENNVEI